MDASRLEFHIDAYASSARNWRDVVATRMLVKDSPSLLLVAFRLCGTSLVYGCFELGGASGACEAVIQAGEVEAEMATVTERLVYEMDDVMLRGLQ